MILIVGKTRAERNLFRACIVCAPLTPSIASWLVCECHLPWPNKQSRIGNDFCEEQCEFAELLTDGLPGAKPIWYR